MWKTTPSAYKASKHFPIYSYATKECSEFLKASTSTAREELHSSETLCQPLTETVSMVTTAVVNSAFKAMAVTTTCNRLQPLFSGFSSVGIYVIHKPPNEKGGILKTKFNIQYQDAASSIMEKIKVKSDGNLCMNLLLFSKVAIFQVAFQDRSTYASIECPRVPFHIALPT